MGAPGAFIHPGTSSASAPAGRALISPSPPAPTSAAPCARNQRRCNKPLPATTSNADLRVAIDFSSVYATLRDVVVYTACTPEYATRECLDPRKPTVGGASR